MSKTIMIVDDVADTRTMMRVLVESHGYDVIEAADGYEALEKSVQYHQTLF